MSKRWLMWKGAILVLTAGTTLALGFDGGCLRAAVQRILIAAAFD